MEVHKSMTVKSNPQLSIKIMHEILNMHKFIDDSANPMLSLLKSYAFFTEISFGFTECNEYE